MLENVIPASEIAAVRDAVLQAAVGCDIANVPAGHGAAPYLVEPRLIGLTRSLLGEHVRVSFTSTIVAHPGATPLQWHADWTFNQHNAGHLDAPYADTLLHLTSIWMLTDFTPIMARP